MSAQDVLTGVEAVLTHEYFIAVYGVTLWYFILFVIYANGSKKKRTADEFRDWWNDKKLNVFLTYFFLPYFIMFDDELIKAYNNAVEFDIPNNSKIFYSLCGPFLEFFIIRWVVKAKKDKKITV